jgi:hypothetical protein
VDRSGDAGEHRGLQPGQWNSPGRCARLPAAGDVRRDRRGEGGISRLEGADGQGEGRSPATLGGSYRERERPACCAVDRRAGEVAGRSKGSNRILRRVHSMVRRRSPTCLRRCYSVAMERSSHPRHARACRRGGRHYSKQILGAPRLWYGRWTLADERAGSCGVFHREIDRGRTLKSSCQRRETLASDFGWPRVVLPPFSGTDT